MSDLISRKATLEKIGEIFRATDPKGEEQFGVLKCSLMVREMPTVDAEPVRRGRWIYKEDDVSYWWECSECHSDETQKSPYCPNCGAYMIEEDKSHE